MKNRTIRLDSLLIVIGIILLYLSILPETNRLVGLLDDIVPFCLGIIWFKELLTHSFKQKDAEIKIFVLLIFISVLGIVSNVISELTNVWTHILIDLYSFWKLYLVFLGTRVYMKRHRKTLYQTLHILAVLSKIFICVSFIFALLNLAGIVHMVEESTRYGFSPFRFVFKNASQFGVLTGVSLAFLLYDRQKNTLLYECLALGTMIFTLKGMSLIIIAVYVLLRILHTKKIKVWQLGILSILLCIVLRYQIYRYLLDETAPRAILLKYGVITALNYFPFGSGFATYGSDMAGRFYSPLYIQYGFTARKSLQYLEVTALNDVYLGMGFGQFGILGALALICILIIIGLPLLKIKTTDKKGVYISIALFTCICGMAVMAGSVKVGPGQLMMIAIALFITRTSFEVRK